MTDFGLGDCTEEQMLEALRWHGLTMRMETRPSSKRSRAENGGVEVGTGSVARRADDCGPDQRDDRVTQQVAGEAQSPATWKSLNEGQFLLKLEA